jgi:NADH-quinone oxidoreductase subunit M
MINHGISSGALFLLVGVIYDRRHTRMVQEFGGLAKVMPLYAVIFIVVTMSSIGVPGTNGFVGEFMVIMGTFLSGTLGNFSHLQAVLAALGVILAAVYMLTVVQKMFFGPLSNPKNEHLPDMNVREVGAVAPMLVLIFIIGLFPKIFLDQMTPTIQVVIDRFQEHRQAYVDTEQGAPSRLLRRRGGNFERGYPLAPATETEGAVAAAPTGAQEPQEPGQKPANKEAAE